jgi:hypothetical protein
MKTLKIALALVAVIGLVAITVGVSFALFTGTPVDYGRIYVQNGLDEDWWVEMRDYMETRYRGIEDEPWFDDMFEYARGHWDEVQGQEWFDEMIDYIDENTRNNSRFRGYDEGYFGPERYGGYYSGRRGFGCMGW